MRVASRHTSRLKTYDLRKLGYIRKMSKLHRIVASCFALLPKSKFCQYQQKYSEKQNFFSVFRSTLFHMKTRVSLKYFVNGCRLNYNISLNSFFPSAISEWNKLDFNIDTQQASILLKKASKLYKTLYKQHFRYS